MPLTSAAADAFGVVTICLVAILILFGLLCIAYSFYLRSRVRSQGYFQLSYFSGPWIIRITFILFVIWWGVGEIIRLSLLRRKGRVLNALDYKWQETICKGYIVSNLGFAEPCLLLTLVFLLRAPLQKMESGILCRKWNGKTAVYVVLFCLPMFVFQLLVILIGPQLRKDKSGSKRLPHYFTASATHGMQNAASDIALCAFPLLNTILHGVFASALTVYLFWLGRRILKLVINKGLQKRVQSIFYMKLLRSQPFLLFCAVLGCVFACLFTIPVADSLALGNLRDLELSRRYADEHSETISLEANQNHLEESGLIGPGRNSDASTKRGSISFRACQSDETPSGPFVELSLFAPGRDASPPGSPPLLGWPMRPPPVDPKAGQGTEFSW
ncbi:hypothetical protein OIU77_028011 [Salix suchowensis]|uniref:Uncharacterized protein n=1 Tax=Salix suchowensis TaxID=1278906 RepID=A0ABQ9BRN3_9ROSI|nr:hypothetical protein OIU77_028011 [Salix suchowensis]